MPPRSTGTTMPPDVTKPDNLDEDIDAVLSDDLLKMTFHDRNEINEEIHGVRSLAVEETPQLIANALQSFRIELGFLPSEKKQAYLYILRKREKQQMRQQQEQKDDDASNLNGSPPATGNGKANRDEKRFGAYADSDEFRLRFLRCLLFDVPRAVRRFANYLNFIQDFWGNSYLARPIQLNDLNAEEMKVLKLAWTQLLPFRDRAGRRILAMVGNGTDMENIESVKAGFYLFDVATRDSIQSQRDGLVIVLDGACWKDHGKEGLLDIIKKRALRPKVSYMERAHAALPYRLAAAHFCWPDSPLRWTLSQLYMISSGGMLFRGSGNWSDSALELNRFRIHDGDEIEMRYKVKAYGIPIELMPLTGTNTIKSGYHNQWMKARRLVENNLNRYHGNRNNGFKMEYEVEFNHKGSDNCVIIVESPCPNDVVFRNGTQSMENPGNAMFRNSILSYWAEKEKATNQETNNNCVSNKNKNKHLRKKQSSSIDDLYDKEFRDQLIKDIEVNKKGRFLEWDKTLGIWVQMTDKARINRKVAMAFYNCTKRVYKPRRRRRLRDDNVPVPGGYNTERTGSASEIDNNTSTVENYQFINPGRMDGEGCCYWSGGNPNLPNGIIDHAMNNTSHLNGNRRNKRSCLAWPFASAPPNIAAANGSTEPPEPAPQYM